MFRVVLARGITRSVQRFHTSQLCHIQRNLGTLSIPILNSTKIAAPPSFDLGKESRRWVSQEAKAKVQARRQNSSFEDRVKKIVAEQLGVKTDEILPESSFVEDLGADSLDTVELVMALEEEFDHEISDEEAEKITTVQAAFDYINSHVSE